MKRRILSLACLWAAGRQRDVAAFSTPRFAAFVVFKLVPATFSAARSDVLGCGIAYLHRARFRIRLNHVGFLGPWHIIKHQLGRRASLIACFGPAWRTCTCYRSARFREGGAWVTSFALARFCPGGTQPCCQLLRLQLEDVVQDLLASRSNLLDLSKARQRHGY